MHQDQNQYHNRLWLKKLKLKPQLLFYCHQEKDDFDEYGKGKLQPYQRLYYVNIDHQKSFEVGLLLNKAVLISKASFSSVALNLVSVDENHVVICQKI